MAPKKGKKKAKVTLSLADFNPNVQVGTPVELAALPSAPKQADEWDAVGGRPEYNSRGFKERTVTRDYDDNAAVESDEAFLQRDWVRGANFQPDMEEGGGAGTGGGDRSWDTMRRSGPLDGPEDEGGDRDFGMMRAGGVGPVDSKFDGGGDRDFGGARGGAGPVDSSFDAPGADRDFGAARGGAGPVDASFDAAGNSDVDFGAARRGAGPVDASFEAGGADKDFGDVRGSAAFDAQFESAEREVDFGKRTGPIEAEFPSEGGRDVNFSDARGSAAFEAEFAKKVDDVDFGGARKGTVVEANVGSAGGQRDVDFSVRSGPVDAADPRGPRGDARDEKIERDFGSARSAAPGRDGGAVTRDPVDWSARKGPIEAAPTRGQSGRGQNGNDFGSVRARPSSGTGSSSGEGTVPQGEPMKERSASGGGHQGIGGDATKERDWGRARAKQPPALPGRTGRQGEGPGNGGRGNGLSGATRGMARASLNNGDVRKGSQGAKAEDDDGGNWTTVQSAPRPRGRGGFHNSRGGRGRPARLVPAPSEKAARPAPSVSTPRTAEAAAATSE